MKTILGILSAFLACLSVFAQGEQSEDLFTSLKSKDSLLFDVGFNTCNLEQFDSLISRDFEFYHDETGIIKSKSEFIRNVKERICQTDSRPQRQLIENSLEVHALKKSGMLYGAIQSGKHAFYTVEKDGTEHRTSVAKFTHVWLLENAAWKLSRAYSFDHQEDKSGDSINATLLFTDRAETEKWLASMNVPALGIGYIQNGEVREVTVYGELEKGRAAPANAIFNVASLAKPVTALVVLKLVDTGEWNLDTPLSEYWIDPDVAGDPRTGTLSTRHVLSHTTGFPNWRYQNAAGKLAFEFAPGSSYQYSGEGFEYLRRALEKRFNKTLDQLASELIFEPLQMHDTHFYWSKEVDESRFAKWHDRTGQVYETYKNTSANAADDLLTTVADYCRFLVHVMKGAGLSHQLYQEMISEQTRVKARQHFGLGWLLDEHIGDGEYAITHGGDDKGVHTIVFILPESKQGLVIFTNGDNGTETYIQTLLFYLRDLGQGIIDVETK